MCKMNILARVLFKKKEKKRKEIVNVNVSIFQMQIAHPSKAFQALVCTDSKETKIISLTEEGGSRNVRRIFWSLLFLYKLRTTRSSAMCHDI